MSETKRNQLGHFTKGNSGKPKGAVNRTAKEARQILTDFLIEKSTDLYRIYDTLDDKEKAIMLLQFSKLVITDHERQPLHHIEQPLFPEVMVEPSTISPKKFEK